MIYPITNKNFELSKSELNSYVQKVKVKKIRKFDYVDNSQIDEIDKELKRTTNQKNYTIIVLEV
jgi:hypothetical protein